MLFTFYICHCKGKKWKKWKNICRVQKIKRTWKRHWKDLVGLAPFICRNIHHKKVLFLLFLFSYWKKNISLNWIIFYLFCFFCVYIQPRIFRIFHKNNNKINKITSVCVCMRGYIEWRWMKRVKIILIFTNSKVLCVCICMCACVGKYETNKNKIKNNHKKVNQTWHFSWTLFLLTTLWSNHKKPHMRTHYISGLEIVLKL